jgi:PHP family Zn ribbon phosphoesterase
LIDVPKEALTEIVNERIAEAIIRVREDKIRVIPGYDGVYGRPIIFEEEASTEKMPSEKVQQLNLTDFI